MYTEIEGIKFLKRAKAIYTDVHNKYENNCDKFLRKARFEYKLYKKVKQEVDRYLSTDFNLIDIIQPNEDKISVKNIIRTKWNSWTRCTIFEFIFRSGKKFMEKGNLYQFG